MLESAAHWWVVALKPSGHEDSGLGSKEMAQRVGEVVFGAGKLAFGVPKLLLVEHDFDIADPAQLIWAFASRAHPEHGEAHLAVLVEPGRPAPGPAASDPVGGLIGFGRCLARAKTARRASFSRQARWRGRRPRSGQLGDLAVVIPGVCRSTTLEKLGFPGFSALAAGTRG